MKKKPRTTEYPDYLIRHYRFTARGLKRMEEKVREEIAWSLEMLRKHTRGGTWDPNRFYRVIFDPDLARHGEVILGRWARIEEPPVLYVNTMVFRLPRWRFRQIMLHEAVHMMHPNRSHSHVEQTAVRILERYGCKYISEPRVVITYLETRPWKYRKYLRRHHAT